MSLHTPTFASRPVSPTSTRRDSRLPRYIQPIPSTLDTDDVDYLRKKNVFILPDTWMRDECLRCYFQSVHPLVPVIEPAEFMDAIESTASAGSTISLLLFWSMMCAAVAFIDMRHLITLGYKERRSARKALLLKAELLLGLNYEQTPLVKAQSLLLMTFWYDNPDDSQDVGKRLQEALLYARKIDPSANDGSVGLSKPDPILRKRILWSCYMQSTFFALAMKQPIPAELYGFNEPALEISDFHVDQFPVESHILKGLFPDGQEFVLVRELADICVGISKLCVCNSHISALLHNRLSNQTSSPASALSTGACESPQVYMSVPAPSEVLRCDTELAKWHRSYGKVLCLSSSWPSPRIAPPTRECEHVEAARGVITALYLSSIDSLYRPQFLQPGLDSILDPALQAVYRSKVCEGCDRMTALYEQLSTQNLVRYLPNIAVPCLVSVTILHLIRVRARGIDIDQQKMQQFHSCMRVLGQMREVYASADVAYRFLEMTAAKIGFATTPSPSSKGEVSRSEVHPVSVPMNGFTPPPEDIPIPHAVSRVTDSPKTFLGNDDIKSLTVVDGVDDAQSLGRQSTWHAGESQQSPSWEKFQLYDSATYAGGTMGISENPNYLDFPGDALMQSNFESLHNLDGGAEFFNLEYIDLNFDQSLGWGVC